MPTSPSADGAMNAATEALRIGVLIPPANIACEGEYAQAVPAGCTVHFQRLQRAQREITSASLVAMKDSVDLAAQTLAYAPVQVMAYACTSGSFLDGANRHDAIAERISVGTGLPCVTTSSAVLSALRALGNGPVFVIAPYPDAITHHSVVFLEGNGFDVCAAYSFNRPDSAGIRAVTAAQIQQVARDGARAYRRARVIFICCTNLPKPGLYRRIGARAGHARYFVQFRHRVGGSQTGRPPGCAPQARRAGHVATALSQRKFRKRRNEVSACMPPIRKEGKQMPYQKQTALLQSGRPLDGWVNQPVSRASSYVFDSVEALRHARARRDTERVLSYAARGTDCTYALEDVFVALEGGYRAKLFPTGQAAIAVVFMAYLKAGDHVLITDAVYEPVRRFCRNQLARMGIEFDFYRADGSDLLGRYKPNTRMVYVESPGSLVFEMVDLPAVARGAHGRGCIVVADNTWGSGLLYSPLALGADVSVMAATKYAGGHADVMMGAVVSSESAWPALEMGTVDYGQTVGADDAWLVLRGLRTLSVRMQAHGEAAKRVAQWLQDQPEICQIHAPFQPEHPSHALWQRDCTGTNGLLTAEFGRHVTQAQADEFANALRLFGIAASWGGYESLVVPVDMMGARSVADWSGRGPLLRLHVGLESTDDLTADLARGFAALRAL